MRKEITLLRYSWGMGKMMIAKLTAHFLNLEKLGKQFLELRSCVIHLCFLTSRHNT